MKSFTNINAVTIQQAVDAAQQAQNNGQSIAFSGGGTDLLQQMKDGTADVDVIINLRHVEGSDQIESRNGLTTIGGLITLNELASAPSLPAVLTEAAASVATPQIRNVATLAGNVTQRPWCWYYRNGFNCFKAGGNQCYSVNGENQQHAIFGGGPSFIVHPSDVAPALLALDARFVLSGPNGERELTAAEFFVLPAQNPQRENVLTEGELLTAIRFSAQGEDSRSSYHKVMDRAAWTHAEVSVAAVVETSGEARGETIVSARLVLGGVATIPWRLAEVEAFLSGKTLSEEVARQAGELAIANAQPLAKNAHKLPMTSAAVERTLLGLA